MLIPIAELRRDKETQPRAAINMAVVDEYTDDLRTGHEFPPVVVFSNGDGYWLADGYHRVTAHQNLRHAKVEAEVLKGGREEAIWYACGANTAHGSRRTNADKRRAVETALRLKPDSSDRAIAEHCGVSPTTVAAARVEIAPQLSKLDSSTRKGADGKTRTTTPANQSRGGKASAEKRKAATAELPQSTPPAKVEPREERAPEPVIVAPVVDAPAPLPAEALAIRVALDRIDAHYGVRVCKEYLRSKGIIA